MRASKIAVCTFSVLAVGEWQRAAMALSEPNVDVEPGAATIAAQTQTEPTVAIAAIAQPELIVTVPVSAPIISAPVSAPIAVVPGVPAIGAADFPTPTLRQAENQVIQKVAAGQSIASGRPRSTAVVRVPDLKPVVASRPRPVATSTPIAPQSSEPTGYSRSTAPQSVAAATASQSVAASASNPATSGPIAASSLVDARPTLSEPKAGDVVVLNGPTATQTAAPMPMLAVPPLVYVPPIAPLSIGSRTIAPDRTTPAGRQPSLALRSPARLAIAPDREAYSQQLQAWAANIRQCLQGNVQQDNGKPTCPTNRSTAGISS